MYRFLMRTRSLPVTDLTSGKKSTKGIAKRPIAHAHIILPVPDMISSGHMTSGDVTSGHVTSDCSPLSPRKYDFVRTHILLMYLHLHNWGIM